MTKNKIAFAGFMGAILMSVGAANAATTSVATKGYVDQQVKGVQTTVTQLGDTVNNLGDTYVTPAEVQQAITDLNLSGTYEALANKVTEITSTMTAEEKNTKYPTVGAVLAAMPDIDPEQVAELKTLLEGDVATQITANKEAIEKLTGDVTVTGSVAQQIANALTPYSTTAESNTLYQAQSTADLQIGTTGGKFRDMTDGEKAALSSGITAAKVTSYDALAGEDGTVAQLQTAINGLNGENGTIDTITNNIETLTTTVGDETAGLVKQVADNAGAIAANATEITKKITMPAACTSGNQTCVLMVANGNISWTPVTDPVADTDTTPVTPETTE